MSIFKSGNPTLSEKKFRSTVVDDVLTIDRDNTMTIKGTLQKFGFLFLMTLGTAFFTWTTFEKGGNVVPFMWTGAIGGIAIALTLAFKPAWSPYLAPLYALLKGLLVGAVSAMYNYAFADIAPNIVLNAVGLTFGVCAAMYLLYSFRIIKATQKFKAVVMTATVGIMVFYLIVLAMRAFGFTGFAFLHESSALGIGFSVFVVALAALNLILDFDMIETGSEMGAPKYMEWYGAFGLLVTIIWLYLEILRLLSKLSSRD